MHEPWIDIALIDAMDDYKDSPDSFKADRLAHLCILHAGYAFQGETLKDFQARKVQDTDLLKK